MIAPSNTAPLLNSINKGLVAQFPLSNLTVFTSVLLSVIGAFGYSCSATIGTSGLTVSIDADAPCSAASRHFSTADEFRSKLGDIVILTETEISAIVPHLAFKHGYTLAVVNNAHDSEAVSLGQGEVRVENLNLFSNDVQNSITSSLINVAEVHQLLLPVPANIADSRNNIVTQ